MIIGLLWLVIIFVTEFPSFATLEAYPQIDISGYKRWFYSKLGVDPLRNYFLATGEVFPLVGGPWQEELNLLIDSKLYQDLDLRYSLKQFPGMTERYNVELEYKNYSLTFGYPEETFYQQDYFLQDYVKGIAAERKWDKLKLSLFSGGYPKNQLASPTINYSNYKLFRNPDYTGDKTSSFYYKDNPYLEYLGIDLGRADIKEESVEFYLDNIKLVKDSEFFFDEDYGREVGAGEDCDV